MPRLSSFWNSRCLVPGPAALSSRNSALAREAAGPQWTHLPPVRAPGSHTPRAPPAPNSRASSHAPSRCTSTTLAILGRKGNIRDAAGAARKPPGMPREPKSGARCGQSNLQRVVSRTRQGCGEPASDLEAASVCGLKPQARTYPSAGQTGRPIRTELSAEKSSRPSARPRRN